jgi:hypothetical protein
MRGRCSARRDAGATGSAGQATAVVRVGADPPSASSHTENLIVTDAGQNQQVNEALRGLGRVWPTDPIEDFIIPHR